MPDDEKKNEFQNDQKTETKLFRKGGSGGPGRGKTKSREELKEAIAEIKALLQDNDASLTDSNALAPVGRVLLQGVTSKDSKMRLDSTKLYLAWLPRMHETEAREKTKDSLPSPQKISNFTIALSIKASLDCMESEEETLCSDCMKKLGLDDEGSEEKVTC